MTTYIQRHSTKFAKRSCASASVSPTTADLAWAAGFLEGEGTFSPVTVTLKNGERKRYARVAAYQTTDEPLNRLQRMFGGSIFRHTYAARGLAKGYQRKPAATWTVNGARARGVMFTLWTFLSGRRQEQVRLALNGGY